MTGSGRLRGCENSRSHLRPECYAQAVRSGAFNREFDFVATAVIPHVHKNVCLCLALVLGGVAVAVIDMAIPKHTTVLVIPNKS